MTTKKRKAAAGIRITDQISLGVVAKTFPVERVRRLLDVNGKASKRQRDLPAQAMVYYVIALALFMHESCREVLRHLLEGIQQLLGLQLKVAGKAAISRARGRLGWEVLRQLYDDVVKPIAESRTQGAWYRRWRLVSLDGSTLDVTDTPENERAFGRPGASRGSSAYPQLRFVALVESGTHVLFGAQMGRYDTSETKLAKRAISALHAGMLCLADRLFFSFKLWNQARATGADLLWRVKKNMRLPCQKRLADGSYLSRIYRCEKDRRHQRHEVLVRVIEYQLEGVAEAEPIYRLLTTILDPEEAPAKELAALYHERWEIETTLDELKTHLRGRQIVLRSRTPELTQQEFWGFLLAHFAVRGLMHEAAVKGNEDPDCLSFIHAVRVIRRKLPFLVAIPPSTASSVSSDGARRNSRSARRIESGPTECALHKTQDEQFPASPVLGQALATG